jgi:hypothetical protein
MRQRFLKSRPVILALFPIDQQSNDKCADCPGKGRKHLNREIGQKAMTREPRIELSNHPFTSGASGSSRDVSPYRIGERSRRPPSLMSDH